MSRSIPQYIILVITAPLSHYQRKQFFLLNNYPRTNKTQLFYLLSTCVSTSYWTLQSCQKQYHDNNLLCYAVKKYKISIVFAKKYLTVSCLSCIDCDQNVLLTLSSVGVRSSHYSILYTKSWHHSVAACIFLYYVNQSDICS